MNGQLIAAETFQLRAVEILGPSMTGGGPSCQKRLKDRMIGAAPAHAQGSVIAVIARITAIQPLRFAEVRQHIAI